jgi:FAD/FMN-containing dehydrogenase
MQRKNGYASSRRVIRDDLNKHLAPYGLLFGPETSTASRAMIGGMIGNNSCGLHSITWGATRDHLLEVKVLLVRRLRNGVQ